MYGRCKLPHETWVPIIEKAYAKLHGCYEALIDGEVDYGLQDLTGGIPQEIQLVDQTMAMEEGTFWSHYLEQKQEGHTLLMGCAVVQDVDSHEVDVGQGMLLNHAYSLLEISDAIPGKVMLKLRNPWGCGEWTGEWSDTDTRSWTREACQALNHFPGGAGHDQDHDDGVFWMEQCDFAQIVTHLYVCLVPEGWHTVHRAGEWKGESAGGRVTCASWKFNPMVRLDVSSPTHAHVCLYQRDARFVEAGHEWNVYTSCIGFVVYKADGEGNPKKKLKGKDVVVKARSKEDREVAAVAVLEPGTYYVVPNTFDAGEEGRFNIMIHTEHPINATGLATGMMEGEDSIIRSMFQDLSLIHI
eukprot:TRINITY_DN61333_c0_g1_i1.p1 TRINITY_DN61333_c0_g1~~TRINITY_DN61333_c0_g1_i1.p1  ORF type:complete len:356 (-),score=81.56 TRINITY_DN61333_c0_g1_i1:167-1234(-)